MRKSNLEKLKDAKHKKTGEPVKLTLEGLTELLIAGDKPFLERRLNPTQLACIGCPETYFAYMGAAGVAKTSTGVGMVLLQCLLEPGTRAMIGRSEYNDLKDTTMRRFFEMLGRLPPGVMLDRDKNPPLKVWLQPIVEGDEVSEVTFMGLNDVIGSHEYHLIFVDEADEVDQARIEELMARLRAPGKQTRRMLLAFNPPAKTHYLYTACTGLNAKGQKVAAPQFKLFRPQPNENDRNLPEGYHADLAKRFGPERRQRLVEGEWGAVFDGTPVYKDFRDATHCRHRLLADPHAQMFRFWDFGFRHPFVLWAQLMESGRLHILNELGVEKIHSPVLIKQAIALGNREYGPRRYIDVGDIAVTQVKDTGSTLALLNQAGIEIQYSKLSIELSVQEVAAMLRELVEGEPALLIDRCKCPILVDALKGGYRLDKKGEHPFKDGFYDNPADTLRYGVWAVRKGYSAGYSRLQTDVSYRETEGVLHDNVAYDERFDP